METMTNARTYFAIQIHSYESTDAIAKLVCHTAKGVGSKFAGLEYLSVEAIGPNKYVRFRSDLEDVTQILERISEEGRGVIRNQSGVFMLSADGRRGIVPMNRMICVARNGRVYRGTAVKLWEEQFV